MEETVAAGAAPPADPERAPIDVPSSLFTRILALVLAALFISQLISVALLWLLPPADLRFLPVATVVEEIESGDIGRNLLMTAIPQPIITNDSRTAAMLEAEIALLMDRPPADVRLSLSREQHNYMVRRLVDQPSGALGTEPLLIGNFKLAIRSRHGSFWRQYSPRDHSPFSSREERFLLLFFLSAVVMLPFVALFANRLAKPLAQFADAAVALGRNPAAPPPAVAGPAELTRTAAAFRVMHERLNAYVSERTRMVAAIAHDMRTPLTRLAFRVAALPPETRATFEQDISEMEAMLTGVMDFVRSATSTAEPIRLELGSLVTGVADDLAEVGKPCTAECPDSLVVKGDPLALKRMVTNLFDNGVKYGGPTHARCRKKNGFAILEFCDDGPGIPEAEIPRLFEPFQRLEQSRNRETGGMGLGLPAVRFIARAHGGDVRLLNRREGGLMARVTLPLAENG